MTYLGSVGPDDTDSLIVGAEAFSSVVGNATGVGVVTGKLGSLVDGGGKNEFNTEDPRAGVDSAGDVSPSVELEKEGIDDAGDVREGERKLSAGELMLRDKGDVSEGDINSFPVGPEIDEELDNSEAEGASGFFFPVAKP